MTKSGVCDLCGHAFYDEPCGVEHEEEAERLRQEVQKRALEDFGRQRRPNPTNSEWEPKELNY